MAPVTDREKVEFLLNIQRLLTEGSFVATYKYALLMALADLAVERGEDNAGPARFTTRDIAEKFIQYYWRQTMPYVPAGGDRGRILKQNTGTQAAILNLIAEARRESDGSLTRARSKARSWPALIRKVESVVRIMPLWKLQTINREETAFLYRNARSGREVELFSGVAENLRLFHGLILDLVQGAWVRHIRCIEENQRLLGETADLREFLFGSERESLAAYRPLLKEIQNGTCFYCRRDIRGQGDVDHFIPWTRYPVDLGHNFVLAHADCNRQKRDYLAAEEHLERWLRRNTDQSGELREFFEGKGIYGDVSSSTRITRWAYEQAETSRAHLWVRGGEIRPIGYGWQRLFDNYPGGGMLAAADKDQG